MAADRAAKRRESPTSNARHGTTRHIGVHTHTHTVMRGSHQPSITPSIHPSVGRSIDVVDLTSRAHCRQYRVSRLDSLLLSLRSAGAALPAPQPAAPMATPVTNDAPALVEPVVFPPSPYVMGAAHERTGRLVRRLRLQPATDSIPPPYGVASIGPDGRAGEMDVRAVTMVICACSMQTNHHRGYGTSSHRKSGGDSRRNLSISCTVRTHTAHTTHARDTLPHTCLPSPAGRR
jgi:hypothetical protein